LYVGASREQVRREVEPSIKHYVQLVMANAASMKKWSAVPDQPKIQALLEQMSRITYESVNDVMGILDTPEACVERLEEIQDEFNPGRVLCWFNFGGLVAHTQVMNSMALFASRVLPHLS